MIPDTEDLAQMLYDSSLNAKLAPMSKVMPLINMAMPGHPGIDEPNKYRWFLIKKFPVANFELTLQDILDEVGDQSTDDKWRHDKIVAILRRGGEEWPALATAAGVLLDGYHRIAAHDTLGIKNIQVLVAVQKPGAWEEVWDELWNEAFHRQASRHRIGSGAARLTMGAGTYYHVTTDEAWAAIQKGGGLRGGDGVCGRGVYLWDDLDLALEFVEDIGAPKPVVLKIETDEAVSCEEALGKFPEKEGDQAYYEHVFLVRLANNGLWRPGRMTRIRIT